MKQLRQKSLRANGFGKCVVVERWRITLAFNACFVHDAVDLVSCDANCGRFGRLVQHLTTQLFKRVFNYFRNMRDVNVEGSKRDDLHDRRLWGPRFPHRRAPWRWSSRARQSRSTDDPWDGWHSRDAVYAQALDASCSVYMLWLHIYIDVWFTFELLCRRWLVTCGYGLSGPVNV